MVISPVQIHSTNLLGQLQQAILATAARPAEQAIALPAAAYTSSEFYAWEVEQVFKRQWLCVGHVSQLPQVGCYLTLTLMNEPLLVVRGRDGQIRVFSRVCPHRGMEILPPDYGHPAQGNRQHFRCSYHHWTFGLEGQLLGAPQMQESEVFDREKNCLRPYRTEIWQGFIFFTFSPELPPLQEFYSGLTPYVERWQIDQMQVVASLEWDCAFNWKVLVENFMEAYHHLGAHYRTFEPMMPAATTWTEAETPNYVVCHLPFTQSMQTEIKAGEMAWTFPLPANLTQTDLLEYTVYLGEPDFLLFVGPDRVYWYLLVPEGPERMKLYTTLLIRPESQQNENYPAILEQEIEALKRFHLEDMEVCTAVQRGLHSATYQPGPLSHLEMPIYLFQRYLARCIGSAAPDLGLNQS